MQTVKLYYAGLFVCCILFMLMLTGCAEFPIAAKIEEMNKLNCKPADSSMCNGWEK